jgi:hypothetical protein
MMGVVGQGPHTRYHDRCKLVAECWNGPKDLTKIEEPNYFLYRVFRSTALKGALFASLRASQRFVEFLRLTWLAALQDGSPQLESLFVPEYFFKTKDEAQAFHSHFCRIHTE